MSLPAFHVSEAAGWQKKKMLGDIRRRAAPPFEVHFCRECKNKQQKIDGAENASEAFKKLSEEVNEEAGGGLHLDKLCSGVQNGRHSRGDTSSR